MTALHWAVKKGHFEICQCLLGSGADPSLHTTQGTSVYELPTTEPIQMLLKNKVVISLEEIEHQLLEAAKNSDLETLKVCSFIKI